MNTRSLSGGVRIVTRILVSILSAPSAYMYRNTAHHITKRVSSFVFRSSGPSYSTHIRTRRKSLLTTNFRKTGRSVDFGAPQAENLKQLRYLSHSQPTEDPAAGSARKATFLGWLFDPTSFLSHKQADRVSAGLRGTRFTGGHGAHTGITAALSGSQPASYIRGPATKGQV